MVLHFGLPKWTPNIDTGQYGGPPRIRSTFWGGRHNKAYRNLGSVLGSPTSGNCNLPQEPYDTYRYNNKGVKGM